MAAKVINIEVCDQTVSVCRTARKSKGVRIYESFYFKTPEGSVTDGVISNPALIAGELRLQLAAHGIKHARNVVFSLNSSRMAVREVKLPPMKKKLIASAIQTNASEYFPIDLKSYHVTYSILDEATTAKPFIRILVMALPLSMIDGYFQLADKAGLSVKAIDSSGNSQYQALKQTEFKGVTAFADVGSTSSMLSFIRDGKLLLQRNFAFGADELINHYMSVSGKDKANYIEALHETDITSPDFAANKLLSLTDIQSDLERLVGALIRSIDYFNSSQWDATVTRIVLTGLGRHVVGLRDLVADSTGLETLFLDDLSEFASFTGGVADAASYVNCVGSMVAPLDLIPKQFLPARRITVDDDDSSIVPGIILCAIIVFGAILISFSSWLGYANTVSDRDALQQELVKLQSAQDIYNEYISYKDIEQSFNSLKATTTTPNNELVSFFEELEKKMPSSILLLSASCTQDGISLNITVGSYTDAASVISTLRGFDSLSTVEVSELNSGESDSGSERISFTATCYYGTNPYLNQINPYAEYINPPEAASGNSGATGAASAQQ